MMYPPKQVTQDGAAPNGRFGTASYASKGSMAAFVTNVKAMDGLDRTSMEYAQLVDRIRELRPALRALGLFDVMEVRNPEIAAILGV